MGDHSNVINAFLVEAFNNILKQEERALSEHCDGQLSIREIHVIEAVYKAMKMGENTMSSIAALLDITVGTLTVAVKTLEKKGYLRREKQIDDKRVVRVVPTPAAEDIEHYHACFHAEMVDELTSLLNEQELGAMVSALTNITQFFSQQGKGERVPPEDPQEDETTKA